MSDIPKLEDYKGWFPLHATVPYLSPSDASEVAIRASNGRNLFWIYGDNQFAEAIKSALNERINPPKCKWTENRDEFWDAECGNSWSFEVGSPSENEMKFCMFCGRPLDVTAGEDDRWR